MLLVARRTLRVGIHVELSVFQVFFQLADILLQVADFGLGNECLSDLEELQDVSFQLRSIQILHLDSELGDFALEILRLVQIRVPTVNVFLQDNGLLGLHRLYELEFQVDDVVLQLSKLSDAGFIRRNASDQVSLNSLNELGKLIDTF